MIESLSGEEANPFIQLTGLALIIGLSFLLVKRGRKKKKSVWEEEDIPVIEAPMEAPQLDVFSNDSATKSPENLEEYPPLPEEGLPIGWTMEQWKHYGQQYLEQNRHNEK